MKLYIEDQFNPVGSFLLIAPRMGNEREIYLTYDWNIVRSFAEMTLFIMENRTKPITVISFDFDLDQYEGYEGKNGLDCAVWVKEYYESIGLPLPKIYIHSRNYYGMQAILNIFPTAIY